jgi:glycosyltransferase involved in cell wall biosynthesis
VTNRYYCAVRILHFAETGEVVGGVERYLETLLAAPVPDLGHAVITHAEGPCRFAGPWPSYVWPWRAPRTSSGAGPAVPDAVPLFHGPPSPAALADLGDTPFAVFCHDHRWWCPSGTRFYLRPQLPCSIHASTLACGVRYHALRCGSLRVGPTIEGFLRARTGRDTLRQAAAVLCASRFMAGEAVRHGARSERVHVTPLPAPQFTAALPAASGAATPIILCASRLTPEKGIAWLLDAFALVDAPARLVIAGDGILAPWLDDAVRDHPRREGITVAGRLTNEALLAAYRDASVVVVPSVWPEPFGLVGIEALSLGRPVVTSGMGGIADWALPELGVLTARPFDAPDLATALSRAIRAPEWSQRAQSRGAAWALERHGVAAHVTALRAALAPLAATSPSHAA